MPELPEVETVRRQLVDHVVGKTIKSIDVYSEKQTGFDDNYEAKLIGKTIKSICRTGKLMVFSFVGDSDFHLLAHLKMTGQMLYESSDQKISGGGHTLSAADTELPGRHTRLQFNFEGGDTLYFNDMRKFGYMKITDKTGLKEVLAKFGPEPTDPKFNCDNFYDILQRSKQPIKALLLDQSKVAGLGNIYVDEALFRAKILPSRPANQISKAESDSLCRASGNVMNESIAVGGTTFQHFADTGGQHGNFKDKLQVFGQHGTPCPRCGSEIVKEKLRGRGTHYCPNCQT